MGGGSLAEMANLVFYGGYTILERMGERMVGQGVGSSNCVKCQEEITGFHKV